MWGVDFSPKYTLEIEKGEGEDKGWLDVSGAKKSPFPPSKGSRESKGGSCTLMGKNQPLWLNVTHFLLTQISEGQGRGWRVCFYQWLISSLCVFQPGDIVELGGRERRIKVAKIVSSDSTETLVSLMNFPWLFIFMYPLRSLLKRVFLLGLDT